MGVQARFKGKLDNLGGSCAASRGLPSRRRRATTSGSCPPPPPTSRRTCATRSRGSAPTCARCWEVRLRQRHLQARRGGSPFPGRAAVRRSEGESPPRRGRQRRHGHHLRGAHPEVQRGAEREPPRALHAAGRRPPHGRPAAGRRPEAAAHEGGRAERLRPVLRLGRHAHHRQGARQCGRGPRRRALRPGREAPAPTSSCSARR